MTTNQDIENNARAESPAAESGTRHPLALIGRVTRVRVFVDRAAITRVRSIADPHPEVMFAPLPLDIDPTTLRASALLGDDRKPIRVKSVTSSVVFAEIPHGLRESIAAERRELDAELTALLDRESTESRARNLIAEYARITTHTISHEWLERDPEFDKWGQALDLLRHRHAELSASEAARDMRRREIERRQNELIEDEHRLGHPDRIGLCVVIALDLPEGERSPVEVELTYVTSKARWSPAYDARHHVPSEGREEHVELRAMALVTQSTGEDWKDVELIATTARPPLSEPPPELVQLYVRGEQGIEEREVVSTFRGGARLSGAPSRSEAPDMETTVEHRAHGRVSVPSSGRPMRVELFESSLPCRSSLEVAPRERPVAVLAATLENRTGRILLPGPVSIFRGANYSGRASLGFVAPNERFRLPLGTDASLRIKRELKAEPEKKTVITGSVTHAYVARTIIENLSSTSLSVVVRDRVPVARSDDVSVKIIDLDRSAEVEKDSGLTALTVSIAGHAQREVCLAYKITAPRGYRLRPPESV